MIKDCKIIIIGFHLQNDFPPAFLDIYVCDLCFHIKDIQVTFDSSFLMIKLPKQIKISTEDEISIVDQIREKLIQERWFMDYLKKVYSSK